MKIGNKYLFIGCMIVGFFTSCSTLEKASVHGLVSGSYTLKTKNKNTRKVYVDVAGEKMDIYDQTNHQPEIQPFLTISLNNADSLLPERMVFKKQSLDIDLTSVLLKYRPSVYGLPPQLTTDLNLAIYAGWRHDSYYLSDKKDPLGRNSRSIYNFGYDFGIFAGPGTTLLNPFTTMNKSSDEYNGMIIQAGIAGFIESNMASFGFAVGNDYLLNRDRKIWIYQNKPWVGLIVGIALN